MRVRRVLVRTDTWFTQRSRSSTWLTSLFALGVVGGLDHFSGVEIVVNFLYLIPVFVVSWRLGRGPGIVMSSCCAVVCSWMDWIGRPGLSSWVAMWNVAGDFGVFALFAVAVTRISKDLNEQRRLNAELQAAMSQVKTLTGLLPICAWCKKIRDQSGNWRRFEEYLSSHAEVDFTHSICPECREKFHKK